MESRPVVSAKPLTKEETKIFLGFIETSKIITCKATNAVTNKMKADEWTRITDYFNAVVTSCHRTPQQLRLKWENLKKNSRKRNTIIRMNNLKTGGGGPDYIPPDKVLDRVAALLGTTVDGLVAEYGGDADDDIQSCISIDNGGGGGETPSKIEGALASEKPILITLETHTPESQVVTSYVEESAVRLTPTPRASGYKRKSLTKNDENRAARNLAIANYFSAKTKLIEANLENILLENNKLKLEIQKLNGNK